MFQKEKEKATQNQVVSSLTKKTFSKHFTETRSEKEKCLRLRHSLNFGVVFGRKQKDTKYAVDKKGEELAC